MKLQLKEETCLRSHSLRVIRPGTKPRSVTLQGVLFLTLNNTYQSPSINHGVKEVSLSLFSLIPSHPESCHVSRSHFSAKESVLGEGFHVDLCS